MVDLEVELFFSAPTFHFPKIVFLASDADCSETFPVAKILVSAESFILDSDEEELSSLEQDRNKLKIKIGRIIFFMLSI